MAAGLKGDVRLVWTTKVRRRWCLTPLSNWTPCPPEWTPEFRRILDLSLISGMGLALPET